MANDKFNNALTKTPQACPPIWMMRQAGRYHDHYQKLKEKYTFKDLCTQPELAAQTALGPIDDFDFDASIYFNDILYPLEALGFSLEYNPGPILSPNLTKEFTQNFHPVDQAHEFLAFQRNAVAATRELLPDHKSLIGFIGGPWTLFTYAVEASHKGHMIESKTKSHLYAEFAGHMLPLLKRCIQDQLDAGAEIVMIFDTSAGSLSYLDYKRLVYPSIEKLSQDFPGKVGYYTKESTFDQVELLRSLPLAGMGFDQRYHLPNLLKNNKTSMFTQGNFDQVLLFSDPQDFPQILRNYLAPFQELSPEQSAGWICGLGHGVLPKTPQENVRNFVRIVREVFGE